MVVVWIAVLAVILYTSASGDSALYPGEIRQGRSKTTKSLAYRTAKPLAYLCRAKHCHAGAGLPQELRLTLSDAASPAIAIDAINMTPAWAV